mgnify:CR=1 FL=1
MTFSIKSALVAAALLMPTTTFAQSLALTPASPQPKAADLSPGLAVVYAYPHDVKNVRSAKKALKRGKPGPAIAGLSYDDNKEGDPVLTADKTSKVAAGITGFIKFDAPGAYVLDFLNNDGLQISIGGQEVGFYDQVHACGYAGEQDVTVPQAGYYALEAIYFQRKGSACLMMEWGPDSDGLELVPDDAFFH